MKPVRRADEITTAWRNSRLPDIDPSLVDGDPQRTASLQRALELLRPRVVPRVRATAPGSSTPPMLSLHAQPDPARHHARGTRRRPIWKSRPRLTRMESEQRPPGAEWRYKEIATALGVAQSTLRNYRARGQMPEPDGQDRYGPWWYPDTITRWHANRPGPGNRDGRRGHRPRKSSTEPGGSQ